MFSLADFGRMITDSARLEAHVEALRRVVTPDSVVLDVGAGTGIMSLLACRAGARRVYAVEPSDVVQLLVEAARDNGYAERVVVLQRRSTEVTLPERADVMVSDLRGVLPPYGTHFADVIDARARLLAPGARLLPTRDTLWAAVASAPEAFHDRRAVWLDGPRGLDLRSALRHVDNTTVRMRARPDDLLTAPVPWATLHYPTLTDRRVRGEETCQVTRPGAAHGLLVWFDTELVEGVGHSSAPGAPAGIYGQILFPWPAEEPLEVGDRVTFDLRADPVGGDYLWTWETRISGPNRAAETRHRQSSFMSLPPSADAIRRRAPGYAPTLSPAGAETLAVLEAMRAGRTIGVIAEELHAAHPARFPSVAKAHGFVAEVARLYGA
jgi:protein arginine N-methyltransferase 1